MSVTVTIPTTSDYREAVAPAFNRIILVGNYIYGITSSSIVKISKTDLSNQTTANFASDGNHTNASDILYVASANRIYVAFPKTGHTTLSEVHPDTLAISDVINEGDAAAGTISMDSDGTYLYLLLAAAANIITLRKYPLSDFSNPTEINVTTLRGADGLIHSGGFLYFIGWAPAGQAAPRVYKVSTSALTFTSSALVSPSTVLRLHHTAANSGNIYFMSEEVIDKVWVINASTLTSQLLTLPTGVSGGDHVGLTSDGVDVWNLRSNGLAIRIASSLETQIYTLSQAYLNNLIGDGTYLYGTEQAKVVRYGINPRPGTAQWVQIVGGGLTDYGHGVAADKDGNVLFTGNAGGYIFLNKYTPTGSVIWSKTLGTGAGYSIACEPITGNIYLTGAFTGAGTLGGDTIPGQGYSDIFVAKYLPNGDHVWSKGFIGPVEDSGKSICIAPDGDLLITGFFYGATNFGGIVLNSAGGSDVFLCKVRASDGVVTWAKRWGEAQDAQNDFGTSVSTDSAGNIFLGGQFGNTVDFGCGNLVSSGLDGFITKRDSAGDCTWSNRIGGTLADQVNGVAVFANGDVVAIGTFMGAFDFGLGTVTSSGRRDIFAVKYSADGNTVRWVKTFGGIYQVDDQGMAVTVDQNDNVIITGRSTGDTDFGGGVIAMQPLDIFVVKYDSNGVYLWGISFGSWSLDMGLSVAVDPFGNVLVSGQFYGEVDFGGIVKTHAGGGDAFVLKLGA